MAFVVVEVFASLDELVVDLSDLSCNQVEVLLGALGRHHSIVGLQVLQAVVCKVPSQIGLDLQDFLYKGCDFRIDLSSNSVQGVFVSREVDYFKG